MLLLHFVHNLGCASSRYHLSYRAFLQTGKDIHNGQLLLSTQWGASPVLRVIEDTVYKKVWPLK